MNIRHKRYGDCDVLSVDGRYCTIRFFDGELTQVKRVQTRMLNLPESAIATTDRKAVRLLRPHLLCSCRKAERDPRFGRCLYCHINALRKWAAEIDRLKTDVGNCLSAPNREKWDAMNSQQKKISVFRAMELGFISWQISSKPKTQMQPNR